MSALPAPPPDAPVHDDPLVTGRGGTPAVAHLLLPLLLLLLLTLHKTFFRLAALSPENYKYINLSSL